MTSFSSSQCGICFYDESNDGMIKPNDLIDKCHCNYFYHRTCLNTWFKIKRQIICPTCKSINNNEKNYNEQNYNDQNYNDQNVILNRDDNVAGIFFNWILSNIYSLMTSLPKCVEDHLIFTPFVLPIMFIISCFVTAFILLPYFMMLLFRYLLKIIFNHIKQTLEREYRIEITSVIVTRW
jgi:hypothetical protein